MKIDNLQQLKNRYNIIGNCEGLNQALQTAAQVASTDLSVLIQGESGVGKEVIPRLIHDNSPRKHANYFAINCGSIPEGTIDSELFGHAKGSFTGAIADREGYFGAADGGTLFLDEVGELPLSTQARLLRVLETGEYIRVGENQIRRTNVRIVAATNVNMLNAIRDGRFRADLFYRLNSIPVSLPPLRERGKDIPLLFRKFAYDFSEKYHCEPVRLNQEGQELLMKYAWPGNIRELRNLTERMSILYQERELTADHLRECGITDDSNGGHGLVITQHKSYAKTDNPPADNDTIATLWRAILSLKAEVDELKEIVYSGNIHAQHPSRPLQLSHGFHQEDHAPATPSEDESTGYVEVTDELPDTNNIEQITLEEAEKRKIIETLERNNGNRRKTARELDISERNLYRKIESYGLPTIKKKTKNEDNQDNEN